MLGPDTVINKARSESRITYLDRIVVGPEGQMISSTQGWMLRPHVHLQMLEEIMVLKHYSKVIYSNNVPSFKSISQSINTRISAFKNTKVTFVIIHVFLYWIRELYEFTLPHEKWMPPAFLFLQTGWCRPEILNLLGSMWPSAGMSPSHPDGSSSSHQPEKRNKDWITASKLLF